MCFYVTVMVDLARRKKILKLWMEKNKKKKKTINKNNIKVKVLV